jgi:acyl-CoA reductase-like NAD-dependent aldehyde dehydrogenase
MSYSGQGDDASFTVRHFPLYIGGELVDTAERAYGISVRAVLDPDQATAVGLWRQLRQGSEEELHAHPHVLGSCALSTLQHGEAALRAAADAAPRWRAVPLGQRMGLVTGIRDRFLKHRPELGAILRAEGCPAILVDAQFNSVMCSYDETAIDEFRALMWREVETGGRRLILRRRPDGVVCVDPPFNTPLAGLFACLALMAGNAMVIRVPQSSPIALSFALHNIVIPALEECGVPPGTLNVVCGEYETHMPQWLDSPLVDSIFYFGSSENGLALEKKCVERGKKAILELGGNDGVLVWRDADLDRAAQALAECFYASGQVCMAPRYVIAHPEIAGSLLERVRAVAAELRPGDPDDENATLSPVLRTATFFRFLDDAVARGATKICGGERIGIDGRPDPEGLFLEPTIIRIDGLNQAREFAAVREETFFPLLSVLVPEPGSDDVMLDRSIAFLNANAFGLRNSLWAEDPAVIDRFVEATTNGGLLKVNDSHLATVPYLSTHGGTGRSGGAHGESNYPFLRASRLQGVAIATEPLWPRESLSGVSSRAVR